MELEFEEPADLRVETATAEMAVGEIRLLLKSSPKFFIEFFLGDELTHEVPQLHEEIFERMISSTHERNLLAIPRDHAKTTLAKLAVAWHLMFTEFRFPVYLSNTNAIALGACKDIMQYFANPNYIAVFGQVKITKASENDSLWQFEMPMGGGRMKRCILRAIGANQQMRGINIDNQRPDFAVIDDVESDENTSSPGLQAKLDRWMFGPFLKAIARNRRKIIWLGNMLAKTSLLARLSQSPRWNPIVFGCLIFDQATNSLKSLWPDRWSIEELIEDYKEYIQMGQLATWMCEMMNMPGYGANGFTQDSVYFQPVPAPDECRAAFLCLDPAFGMDAEHDNSSVTVHVIREDGLPMVAEEITGKMTEAEILDAMILLATKWHAWVWGIEAIAAQRVLISLFNVLLAQQNLIHRVTMLPLISGSGDSKTSRIRAWASMMGKKEYALYEEAIPIVTELFGYDAKKKKNVDDRIDSCSYGPIMLNEYLTIILAAAQGKLDSEPPRPLNEMEVCGV